MVELSKEKVEKGKVLKIVKGKELKIHVSEEICHENSFMYPAYQQAKRALDEIISGTREFRRNNRNVSDQQLDEHLFSYSGNVIAFAAQRGAGKTQTMLSFSQSLTRSQSYSFPDQHFFVMPPIAPSVLEKNRDLLYVVLSKMYHYAEELANRLQGQNGGRNIDPDKLWIALNNCLSGINGLKSKNLENLDDLSALRSISDGISLRRYFYQLVQCVIELAAAECGVDNTFLVLQIDDADSQIRNCYSVLEDVRKYLVVPNLVILMSTDIDMLHMVIYQDHLNQFPDIKNTDFMEKEVSRMCRKYIDKLIPPSHMVILPQLEKYIETNGNQLSLEYMFPDGTAALDWAADNSQWNFQDTILMLIYRKTGVAFVSGTRRLNHIIPRTLRGLNQLIYLLSDMRDIIPWLDQKQWSDLTLDKLLDSVEKQASIAKDNLTQFSNYFTTDWIGVKIRNANNREFLQNLCSTPNDNYVQNVMAFLKKSFGATGLSDEWFSGSTLYHLDRLILKLEEQPLPQDEYLLLFATRILRSLSGHQQVWREKERAVRRCRQARAEYRSAAEKPVDTQNFLVFDFDSETTYLPNAYPVSEQVQDKELSKMSALDVVLKMETLIECGGQTDETRANKAQTDKAQTDKAQTDETQADKAQAILAKWTSLCTTVGIVADVRELLEEAFFIRSSPSQCKLNAWGFITLLLRLGSSALAVGIGDKYIGSSNLWKTIYCAQEMALLIAANWDIQTEIYQKWPRSYDLAEKKSESFQERILDVFGAVDTVIKNINNRHIYQLIDLGSNADDEGTDWSLRSAVQKLVMQTKENLIPEEKKLPELFSAILESTPQKEEPKQDSNGEIVIPPEMPDEGEGKEDKTVPQLNPESTDPPAAESADREGNGGHYALPSTVEQGQ